MTEMQKRIVAEIREEIRLLEAVEVHVETNQGTYGAAEACRKVGCGDPQFANREVYETVGGVKRETGPDESDAPGRMRPINRQHLADLREKLVRLKKELRQATA